jgi:eukaryotic-like serine/threonine-protein kinase
VSADVGAVGEERIGGYRYVRTLQRGQNSLVMEVSQEGSGKRFVMKQLLESRSGDAAERRAFAFEAKLGMQFRHPQLIRVYEYVPDKVQPYFVMDYFQGITLRLVIGRPQDHALPKGRAHFVLEQSARGLAYMHEKGWTHRDIKPENILVNKGGEARVIDYALAKRIPSGLGKLLAGKPPREGTYSYIPPEQIRREPPSARADIYSFGITCYELACGRQPFRANSPTELLTKHLQEKPSPPTVHNKAITPEFSDLVMAMIQKRPADRLGDLQEFLSKFSRIKIYQDDPELTTERGFR